MEIYLNSHEFFDKVWERVPEDLVSNKYMDENTEFLKDLTFEYYKDYSEDRVSINYVAKKLSSFFRLLFIHKPLLSDIVDDEWINAYDY